MKRNTRVGNFALRMDTGQAKGRGRRCAAGGARQAERRTSGLTVAKATQKTSAFAHKCSQRRSNHRIWEIQDKLECLFILFFLGAALLRAAFCFWQPHCVHSVPLCEVRRGAPRRAGAPHGR